MKKRVTTLLMAAMLLVLLAAPAFAMTWNAYVSTKDGSSMCIRTGPTKDASVQVKAPYGAQVVILGEYDDGTWITVSYKGYDGYALKRSMSYDKPGPKPTPKPNPKPTPKPTAKPENNEIALLFKGFKPASYKVSITPGLPGGFGRMRWAPSKDAPVLKNYHESDVMEVISQNGGWCQVRDMETGETGFMMRKIVQEVYSE